VRWSHKQRALVAGLVTVVLLASLTPTLVFGFGFDTDPMSLGFPSRKSVYPRLAAGGDSVHAFWAAGASGVTARSFSDSGRTAGGYSTLSACNPACGMDSWHIAAAGSRVWATWVELEPINPDGPNVGTREQVYAAASTDSGGSWGAPMRISDKTNVSWFPQIAAAGDKAYVMWWDVSKGLRLRTIDGDVPRPDSRVLTRAFRPSSPRVAAADDPSFDYVTVAWDDSKTGLTLESSEDAGTTFPHKVVQAGLELDALASSARHVYGLATERLEGGVTGGVKLLSSANAGGSYSPVGLLNARSCKLGCSSGDVAALDDRVAVAYHDDGGIYVASGQGSSLSTELVAAAPSGGFPRVALSSNATGVVWSIRSTELQRDGTMAAARPDGAGKWTVLSPTQFWGPGAHPNTVLPEISGLNTGFGLAFMAFDSLDGAIRPDTAFQPTYRHADAADPNLELLDVTATQAVDGATLVKGKATKFLAKVRNTTGRSRAVKARLTTRDDGGGETSRTVSVGVKLGTTTLLIPGVDEPVLRPGGETSFSWSVELDSEDKVDEVDETDNLAAGSARVEAPIPDLDVLFVPIRVGGSPHPTCGGTTRATRELEQVLVEHKLVDAVMPLDERRSTYTTSCTALTSPGPKVNTASLLHGLGRIALAAGNTKVVGVTEDGFFKTLSNDPADAVAVGMAFAPAGSGLYRCQDGLLIENGVATGADLGLLRGDVLAHELLHTTGFDHLATTAAPGTWVANGSLLDANHVDLMHENVQLKSWISKGTYDALRATLVDPQPSCSAPARRGRAVWAAALESGPTLAIGGCIDAAGTVTADPFYERETMPDVALGADGDIEARLFDAGGATLGSASFDPHEEKSDGDASAGTPGVGSFRVRVPLPVGTRRVQLYRDGVLRLERTRSATAPTVTVSAPDGGETFTAGDDVTVDWSETDGDGDALHHLLALSTDGGATWSPLAADVTGTSFTFTATDTMVSDDVRVRVDATDGWRTASDASDASFAIVPRTTAGRIVYSVHPDSGSECGALMTIRADGSDPQMLHPGPACNPKWSPDGTQVAFSGGNQGGGIWVVNADGSNPHGIAEGSCTFQYPDWSPDGTQFVFLGCSSLNRVNADGTGLVDLEVDAGTAPTWSPAGDRIAFPHATDTNDTGLGMVDPDGQNLTVVPLNVTMGGVAWSPDATRLAYTGHTPTTASYGYLWTADPDGTNRTNLGPTPPPETSGHYELDPAWSPEGDRIVFMQETNFGTPVPRELAIQNADGTDEVLLTHDGNAGYESAPDWQAVPAPSDAPIVADAGGPYAGPEGSAIALDAADSTAVAPIAAYAWDLDGDGEFDDATGAHASLTPPGHGNLSVAVRVTDERGHADVAGAALTVANVDPVVSFESPGSIDPDGRATIAARVGDPGDSDLALTVDWHDGTPLEDVPLLLRATGAGDVLALHDYAGPGPHTATVHADDGGGGLGQATTGFTALPANRAPTVGNATGKTLVGQPVAIEVPTDDPDGNRLQLTVASGPSHGAAEPVDRDGLERLFIYTPAGGFHGTDTFTVTASDGRGGTAIGTVTITVVAPPGATPEPTAEPTAGPTPSATPTPPPAKPRPVPPVAADAACANGRLQLIDVYPDGRRVRIMGVAPAAARGKMVAITFTATRKRVATARVAPDLSFSTTAPLPARRLRSSDRARYVARVGGLRSRALKLARRMFLRSVTRAANRLSVAGQVVKPLARKGRDRRITLRITTTCAAAASASRGRKFAFSPAASGKFRRTIKLTAGERSAQALYVRAQTRVRRGARSNGLVRTFSLTRGVAVR
jgi:hypothetical protein